MYPLLYGDSVEAIFQLAVFGLTVFTLILSYCFAIRT